MVKKRLQVTIREDIVFWIDQEIEKLRFANRSHGIEYALLHLMEQEKKKATEE
jgi:Arc/MetJ-type ribon-helix-helix transcriptional regulator